ncbi:hypothetical protein OHB14_60675 [Streptomyces sp. NBC_01613]|uniref:hypothetical protein n=1 Tax=Streptomyces sp. NBC_01613 TaxID=2975896 RepID=UPI00386FDFAC
MDDKGGLVCLGSPAGHDVCNGSLTGKQKQKLVLNCVNAGAVEKTRVYRATVVVESSGAAGQGPILMARWDDGHIDYLTKD